MDPDLRRWWRLLEDLPARLGAVTVWDGAPAPPADGDGHLHVSPTLVLCLAGTLRALRPGDGARCDLQPGEALVIAPGVWHGHAPARPGTVFFAQGFLPRRSDVLIGDHRRRFRGLLPREPARRLLGEVLAAGDGEARRGRLAALIGQVLAETVEDQGQADPRFRAMLHRLWSGLHRGVAVADLLRASGLSRAQAYRLFAAGYGLPPKAALESARLELAEGLLAAGLGPAAVAGRCGFASTRALARARRRAAAPGAVNAPSRRCGTATPAARRR